MSIVIPPPGVIARITSIAGLLRHVTIATIAAQEFVARTYLSKQQGQQPVASVATSASGSSGGGLSSEGGAIATKVKSQLEHQGGTPDFVTAADFAVQHILFTSLCNPAAEAALQRRLSAFATAAPEGAPLTPPRFRLIGEEDPTVVPPEVRDVVLSELLDRAEQSTAFAFLDRTVFQPLKAPTTPKSSTVAATSVEEEDDDPTGKRVVDVFIDPIDGTNAMLSDDRKAPMLLVGVTINGVPAAGVVCRVFEAATATKDTSSAGVSAVQAIGRSGWPSLSVCLTGRFCVLWGEVLPPACNALDTSRPAPAAPAPTLSSSLRFALSATNTSNNLRGFVAALRPFEAVKARGAGHKCMMVVDTAAADRRRTEPPAAAGTPLLDGGGGGERRGSGDEEADAFLSTGAKYWDICAPHAFLRHLGGAIACQNDATVEASAPLLGSRPPSKRFRELTYDVDEWTSRPPANSTSEQAPTVVVGSDVHVDATSFGRPFVIVAKSTAIRDAVTARLDASGTDLSKL